MIAFSSSGAPVPIEAVEGSLPSVPGNRPDAGEEESFRFAKVAIATSAETSNGSERIQFIPSGICKDSGQRDIGKL
jgi:hypothetical protein